MQISVEMEEILWLQKTERAALVSFPSEQKVVSYFTQLRKSASN